MIQLTRARSAQPPKSATIDGSRRTKTLADYTHIVGRDLVDEIRTLAEPLKGRRGVHISATAFGGGVIRDVTGSYDLAWIGGLFPVVEEFRSRPAGALSGGQQQQLAIARALLAGPDVLLLDEPSLGLAPTVVETVWDALRQIRDRGVTIVLVEQRAQITVALADRTYVLTGGRVRATLTPSDAHDTARLVTAYFGS